MLKEHKKSQKELAKKNGKEFKETDWVFTTKTYQGYVSDYTTDIMKRALKETKIENYEELCVHCLRHTYCSIGIMNGIKAEEMQKILGHSDIQTTINWYTHIDPSHVINASKKVSSGILG